MCGSRRPGPPQLPEMEIVVDAHERYAYRFAAQQARTVTRALPCGDYAVTFAGNLVASVERKSLSDLVSSLTSGRLRFALAELAALPRAAVVVEDRYSQVFALERVRPAVVADGLAELQVRWPSVPIVFCETRKLAEEWTYRYLAAARLWAETEDLAVARMGIEGEDRPATAVRRPNPPPPRCVPGLASRGIARHRPWAAPPGDPAGLARRPSRAARRRTSGGVNDAPDRLARGRHSLMIGASTPVGAAVTGRW